MEKILNFAVGSFTVGNILAAVIVLALGLVLSKYIMKIINRSLEKSKLDKTLSGFINAVLKALVYFILGVIVADCLNISVASLVAVFSVAGLAVSLAAENSLSNLAGGILLIVMKPFKAGDYVEAAGSSGTVVEVGLIYTELLTIDNKHVYIPNKDISAANIVNYSQEEKRRIDLKFNASYNDDTEKVKFVLLETVKNITGVINEPEPFVRVSGYKESCVEYTVRVWCKNEDYWDIYFTLMEKIKPAFDESGIEITYNHLNVHIIEKRTED